MPEPVGEFPRRLRALRIVLILWALAIVIRLIHLQVFQYEFYKEKSQDQTSRVVTLAVNRGDIVDRSGRLLAVSLDAASIYASPRSLTSAEREEASRRLSKFLGPVAGGVFYGRSARRSFVWVKRQVPFELAARIQEADIPGVGLLPESKRVYPRGRLAAQLMGFVGLDNQGLSGVELAFDKQLKGEAGQVVIERDARGHAIQSAGVRFITKPTPGRRLILTIDEGVQYVAQRELQKAMEKYTALSGTVIAMNVTTGEILALVQWPDFDPNHYAQFAPDRWKIKPITDVYEPGSTFKTITFAGVLNYKVFALDDVIPTPEKLRVGTRTIGNSHAVLRDPWPKKMANVLAESINTGTATMALKLGTNRFYKTIKAFGFGDETGIDLPGEVAGIVRPPNQWWEADLPMMSFGQAIAVTPLQMVVAYSAIANGGRILQPTILKGLETEEGQVVQSLTVREKRRDIISKEAVREMIRALRGVVTLPHGSGRLAKSNLWITAVKTGTAQKPAPGGGYMKGKFIASMIGFAPADKPLISVLVMLNEPHGSIWGETTAAPIFKKVAEAALLSLGTPPSPMDTAQKPSRPVL